jgi:hypothetical protein
MYLSILSWPGKPHRIAVSCQTGLFKSHVSHPILTKQVDEIDMFRSVAIAQFPVVQNVHKLRIPLQLLATRRHGIVGDEQTNRIGGEQLGTRGHTEQ